MLPAIEFNDQLGGMADEIGDVSVDRHLPPKACADQTMIAQFEPQQALGIGQVLA